MIIDHTTGVFGLGSSPMALTLYTPRLFSMMPKLTFPHSQKEANSASGRFSRITRNTDG